MSEFFQGHFTIRIAGDNIIFRRNNTEICYVRLSNEFLSPHKYSLLGKKEVFKGLYA